MPTALTSAAPKLRTVLQTAITKASPRLRACVAWAAERFPQLFDKARSVARRVEARARACERGIEARASGARAWSRSARSRVRGDGSMRAFGRASPEGAARVKALFERLPRKAAWALVAVAVVAVTGALAAVTGEPKQKVATAPVATARVVSVVAEPTPVAAPAVPSVAPLRRPSCRLRSICSLRPRTKGTPRSRTLVATSPLRPGGPALCHRSRPPGTRERLSRAERRAAAAANTERSEVAACRDLLEQPARHGLRGVREARLLFVYP